MGQFVFNPVLSTLAAALLSIVGVVIWWLVRKRENRLWLPTVRILELESRRLPRLQWVLPPLVSFLAFVVAVAVLILFSTSPTKKVLTPYEPNEERYHVLLDLSPSLQSRGSIAEYRQTVLGLWGTLSKTGRVSISTTRDPKFQNLNSLGAVSDWLEQIELHRAGLKLGATIKDKIEDLGKVDRLFVVSDGDRHSWGDFNWQFLSDQLDVRFVAIERNSQVPEFNLFVKQVDYVGHAGSSTMAWDVEVMRSGKSQELTGVLKVGIESLDLAEANFTMSEERDRQVVRIGWSASKLAGREQTSEVLNFRIVPDVPDANTLDNLFRANLRGQLKNGLLISAPSGELMLEDPSFHLQHSLKILDFRIQRYDYIEQPGPRASEFPLWVVMGGQGHGVDRFCPKSIESARLRNDKSQGARAFQRTMPIVWLVPQVINADYRELCHCYARLMVSESPMLEEPDYCADVASRPQYVKLLQSLGAKQVGGNVDQQDGAIAFHSIDKSGLEVTALTLPLTPSYQTGVNHAGLPWMVRSLLQWQNFVESGSGASSWPRIADIAAVQSKPEWEARLAISNIPLGESMMRYLGRDELPARWIPQTFSPERQIIGRRDQTDPLPLIRLFSYLIIGALLIEALFLLGRQFRRMLLSAVLVAIGVLQSVPRADAQIQIDMYQFPLFNNSVKMLSREVALRTSIEMAPQPANYSSLAEALKQPWLWVRSAAHISDAKGRLLPEVVAWVKRGGFLVIEERLADQRLDSMVSDTFEHALHPSRWYPIPPDHELMRSFHLLDSLPVCAEQVWKGFHFDGRLAILNVPFDFLASVMDRPSRSSCTKNLGRERAIRIYINLLMVVLATDYKKDQIHLPEILKRLR